MSLPIPHRRGPDGTNFPGGLVPTPANGSWRFAERVFYTTEFEGPYITAVNFGQMFPRGTVWALPPLNGYFWVEETTVESQRGGLGKVRTTFVWLAIVPPPEWSITPFELNPQLFRHSFFSSLTPAQIQQAVSDWQMVSAQGITAIQAAISGSAQGALISNLLNKLIQGKETWYIVGFKYVWTRYFTAWTGTTLRGGYREKPIYSVSGVGPGATYLPGQTDNTWDYLREADEMVWSNGLFKVTMTWLGAPGGWWDTDLYTTTPQ